MQKNPLKEFSKHSKTQKTDINKTKEKDDAKNKASLNVESTNLE